MKYGENTVEHLGIFLGGLMTAVKIWIRGSYSLK